jgi:predicted transcriptional regulator
MEVRMPDLKTPGVKDAARETIDSLPDEASWDDLMYHLYVRQKIEAGLRDIESGRTVPTSEVRSMLGLDG